MAPWPALAATITRDSNDLQQNSLRSGTGNFSEQNSELELPNREIFAANQKRESKNPGALRSDRRVFFGPGRKYPDRSPAEAKRAGGDEEQVKIDQRGDHSSLESRLSRLAASRSLPAS